MPLYLNDNDVNNLISMPECVEAVQDAFRQEASEKYGTDQDLELGCQEVFIT